MKNKNLFKIITIAFFAGLIVLAGCKKEEIIKMIGIVQGIAYDGNTNEPIGGVTYSYMVNGQKFTDSASIDGYTVQNLPSGRFDFTFSKPGYTTVVTTATIDNYYSGTSTIRGGSNDYQTITLNPNLYTMDGVLNGVVYKNTPSGLQAPAEGVTVMLDYAQRTANETDDLGNVNGISPSLYTATTDADGKYSFTEIPATEATLIVQSFNDGSNDYSETSRNVDIRPGATTITSSFAVNITNPGIDWELKEITSNSDNLELTFNKTVDQATFKARLTDNTGKEVDITISWLKALSTVLIDPVAPLRPGSYYYLTVQGTAEGVQFNVGSSFNALNGIVFTGSNTLLTSNTNGYNPTEVFDVSSDITLTFNMDVDQTVTETKGGVWLYDNGNELVEATVTYSGNTITINPAADLTAGAWYNIDFEAYSSIVADGGWSDDWYFKTLAVPAEVPGQVTDFALYEPFYPTGYTFDYDDDNIVFQWTNVIDGIARYEVWAKDTYNNQNYVRVFSSTVSSETSLSGNFMAYWINLPSQFDHFSSDGIQTPLSHGTSVTYKIRGVNTDGVAGPWSDEVTISDETAMTGISFSGSSTTDNTTGTEPRVATRDINFPEYVDLSTTPALTFTGTITASDVSGRWYDNDTYRITITVPAGDSFVGDVIDVTNFVDSSGNVSDAAEDVSITLN